MKSASVEFGENARRVYAAVRKAVEESSAFRGIRCDDRAFRITASHGLPLWGEDIRIKVVATGTGSSEVVVESADKVFFNIFKWGNNRRNVGNIMDFVRNEVYRLLPVMVDGSPAIRLAPPEIRLRRS